MQFKSTMNSCGLKWTFSSCSQSVVFMDMTISIEDGKTETALYSKPLALYLYIFPHSCHLPGVFTGLIYGMILRIHQLCSKETDVNREIYLFTRRILDRGHNLDEITTLFSRTIINTKKYFHGSQPTGNNSCIRKQRQLRDRCTFNCLFIPTTPRWASRGLGNASSSNPWETATQSYNKPGRPRNPN